MHINIHLHRLESMEVAPPGGMSQCGDLYPILNLWNFHCKSISYM